MSTQVVPHIRILDSLSEGCQVIDSEYRYVYLNDAAVRHGKLTHEQLLGRTMMEMYPGIDKTSMFSRLRSCMIERVAQQLENEFTYPDGTTGWFALRFEPVPEGVFILSEDVSERKHAESALRVSERKYQALFEHAPLGMARSDLRTSALLDVNHRMLDLLECDRARVVGSGGIGGFWKDLDARGRLLAILRTTGTVDDMEVTIQTATGGTRRCVVSARVLPGGASFEEALRDVTQRRQAEAELRQLSTAISHAAESVIITDTKGSIVYVNPAFEAVSGYSRDEVIGANPRLLKSGKQSPEFYGEMWLALNAGQTWRGRLINRRKDGSLFTEDATISPVPDADGAITHFVCVKRDVTSELALEEQFRQSQKMEAIGQLAGGVAHDFNNLLSLIIGYSDVLLQSVRTSDPMHADIAEIRKAGERASTLTRQLLAFSRKQALQPTSINLNDVASGMQEMLGRLLGEAIQLHSRLADDCYRIRADKSQMEQVLLNLAVNARDAMPNGGRLSVSTSNVQIDEAYAAAHLAVTPGPHVMLTVSDNGIGMDDETQARIFEPFFTTKSEERGTGLGLSTVYGIIKQSGGSIWVYSELGVGTTFKIYLPRESSAYRESALPSSPVIRSRGGERILLVEDEAAVRALAARLLKAQGYVILEASNGDEAIEVLANHHGDVELLLTDVVMPRMSGVELGAKLTATYPALKVLYMSGYAENAVGHFEDLNESEHFIGKPFSAADLCQVVRKILDGH